MQPALSLTPSARDELTRGRVPHWLHSGRDQPVIVRRLGVASLFQDVASDIHLLLPDLAALRRTGASAPWAADGVVAFVGLGRKALGSQRPARRRPVRLRCCPGASARMVTALLQLVALRLWVWLAGVRSAPRDALIAAGAAGPPGRGAAYQRGLDHLGAARGRCRLLASGAWFNETPAATVPALAGSAVALASGIATAPALAAPPTPAAESHAPRFASAGLRDLSAPFSFARQRPDAFPAAARELLRRDRRSVALWAALHPCAITATRGGCRADRPSPWSRCLAGSPMVPHPGLSTR
jgi:hypothetical protein